MKLVWRCIFRCGVGEWDIELRNSGVMDIVGVVDCDFCSIKSFLECWVIIWFNVMVFRMGCDVWGVVCSFDFEVW